MSEHPPWPAHPHTKGDPFPRRPKLTRRTRRIFAALVALALVPMIAATVLQWTTLGHRDDRGRLQLAALLESVAIPILLAAGVCLVVINRRASRVRVEPDQN